MKKQKLLIAVMLFATIFSGCKKNDTDAQKKGFDPTQYYIVSTEKGAPVAKLAGAITFNTNGKCFVYSTEDPVPEDFDYQYKDGHLKITGSSGGNLIDFVDFTISDGQIQNTNSTLIDLTTQSLALHKIPGEDAFNHKTYIGTAYYKNAQQTTTQFTLLFSGGVVAGDFNYTVINNGIAVGQASNSSILFALIDGKLAFRTSEDTYGYFAQQQ